MNRQEKVQYQQTVENYLEKKGVYQIFQSLTNSLIINQPDEPLEFLIKQLKRPQTKQIFVVGPPGSNVTEIALQICDHYGYTCVSVGDLLKREISKKSDIGQKIEYSIKNQIFVQDELVIQVVMKHLQEIEGENKKVMLEGFPKTRIQGLALQRAGIIPQSFLILNYPYEKTVQACLSQISSNQNIVNQEQTARDYTSEYFLNISQLKGIYQQQYNEVDADQPYGQVIESIASLLKYRIRNNAPSRPKQIVVTGLQNGRAELAKSLATKYGFVYVSVDELVAHQISQKTEVGRAALHQIQSNQNVADEILNGLVNSRINKPDCLLQGLVLDGYPQNEFQLNCLKDLGLRLSCLVVIAQPHATNEERQFTELLQEKFRNITFQIKGQKTVQNQLEEVSLYLENSQQ